MTIALDLSSATGKVMTENKSKDNRLPQAPADGSDALLQPQASPLPKEFNGPKGPEPTRYGDWERNGRCIDF